VAVSDCVRRKTIEYYRLPESSVSTCLNFVDLERIDDLAAHPPPAWDDGRFHIVAAGRLHAAKGFSILLDALQQVVHASPERAERIQLHLLGTGPLESELRGLAHSLGLQKANVEFHGFVENPFPFLRKAQLFCLSSLFEGLPTVLLEAMACRTPVLATACECGPDEILCQGQYGRLVKPGDSRALAAAIDDAMANYATWEAYAGPARDHVERVYSGPAGVARVESLLSSVVDAAPSP
jgi:glycosyltransferase involved in cell wall biosynthesis